MPLNNTTRTFVLDQNARYYGIPIIKLMENAGKGIAKAITNNYGSKKKIGIFCGLGNNGGDGFAAGRYLCDKNDVTVFLIGTPDEIKTEEAKKNWEWLKCRKIVSPSPEDIPNDFDVVIEALFGTRLKGKPREPFLSIIRKMEHMKGKKVTIDLPPAGFTYDLIISIHYPKSPEAVVVDIGIPKDVEEKVGPGDVQVLYKPPPGSHKGENGKLMIIAGSEMYHGASILPLKVASRIVDLVYYSSVPKNNAIIQKMKSELADFVVVPCDKIEEYVKKVDCVLVGPGMGKSEDTVALAERLLEKYKKKFVLDADALNVNSGLLNERCIITPHSGEFEKMFDMPATETNAKKMAKKQKCVIVLKGKKDVICSPEECKYNSSGNQGMTKGGTGDVLAGLIAALACKNDPFLAARAGVFVNGLAGDRLAERVGFHFNASDLVEEIPKTMKWCEDF